MQDQHFDALSAPLQGSNLIEASAGTGKTYSIAILSLRLLLEKQIPIQEILMVTFTKAAVAELEERIRLFVRQAHHAAKGEPVQDASISHLVQQARGELGQQRVLELLDEALIFLDELSVLTIHSFCQQTLTEFAFETGLLFGAELLQGTGDLLLDQINMFWREQVTGLPLPVLQGITEADFSRSGLNELVTAHMGGKRYYSFHPGKSYVREADFWSRQAAALQTLQEQLDAREQQLLKYIQEQKESLHERCMSNRYASVASGLLSRPREFLGFIRTKKTAAYTAKLFPELLEDVLAYEQEQASYLEQCGSLCELLNCGAIEAALKGITQHKLLHNQLSFDDLIEQLHKALVQRDNPELLTALREKYRAVFIDEFQDTDRYQYEIFEKAFQGHAIVFFIGDPKQSIYAWRKADIFTYFKAKSSVDVRFSMNVNYRSSGRYIQAMNRFFMPQEGFDTFAFRSADPAGPETGAEAGAGISYIAVDAPSPERAGLLLHKGRAVAPLVIHSARNQDQITELVLAQVIDLLQPGNYFIEKGGEQRPVKPADIGILVRRGKTGLNIKHMLSSRGLPAVLLGDEKVLQSAEAQDLLYLLQAIQESALPAMIKALYSGFTSFTQSQLLELDQELLIDLLRKYKMQWQRDGIFAALNSFMKDFSVKQHLLTSTAVSGERVLTNLHQLIELLHRAQSVKQLSSLELIGWLQRGIAGYGVEGDEFEQRIESDEQAIKIVTIHKSKGLEYNIVLAPELNFKAELQKGMNGYRDPESGEYVSLHKSQLSAEQEREIIKQLEQENRRLIYVALTRAVYACFLFNSNRAGSSILPFYQALGGQSDDFIQYPSRLEVPEDYRYLAPQDTVAEKAIQPVKFSLLQTGWRKMSYSMLRAAEQASARERSGQWDSPYDEFIFSQLKAGAKTGNMLHFIFENISFNNEKAWKFAIENAVKRYYPLQKDTFEAGLSEMLNQVMKARIQVGGADFCLAQLADEDRISELEFDFTVSPFRLSQLSALSRPERQLRLRDFYQLEGVMNGKVDLFFSQGGRYYLLDWKSNFLGDRLDSYDQDGLRAAMNEQNYHLQYLIYTLAVKKYLESRLPDFDYERDFGGVVYLFIRGLRAGSSSGVFTCKPSQSTLLELGQILESPASGA